ncbi:MAG: cation:proton antiporter [Gammaproteobacteria bacterium]|nr:cation:proton antiporter [Gammaproteobacteria bacterium]
MAAHDFFLSIMIILISARVLAEIAHRMKIPSVLGELMAGVILGPSLLGLIEPEHAIHLLAEIGIILLLFKVGLETDADKLIKAGPSAFIVAIGGFIIPFSLSYAVCFYLFDLSQLVSLFIGGTLTATSIGITIRVLKDLNQHDGFVGQIVLGAAVLDDIFGVILLALLYETVVSTNGISLANTGKIIGFIAVFFLIAPIAAKLLSQLIKRFDTINSLPGLIPTSVVALVLFFAWLAHVVGAPELLGGFAAGLALSRRFFFPFGFALKNDAIFAEHIERDMQPIVHLFTPIFFVMVGLSLDLSAIDWQSSFFWFLSFALLVTAILGKFAAAMVLRLDIKHKTVIGTAMMPRGEVGLIFAELGRSSGIFVGEVYAALIFVIALTTLVAPFLLNILYQKYDIN